mmetsp:Transcript_20650/g.50079  ORF Transcript_20650/g.50079 Transcript_20650/m.50079 type:complete len:248 (-) Transcript_20650:582-1325(-)
MKSAHQASTACPHPSCPHALSDGRRRSSRGSARGWAASPSRSSPVSGSVEADRDPRSSAHEGTVEGSRLGRTENQNIDPPMAATSHRSSTYSDMSVTDSRPDAPRHRRKAAAPARVHDHSAPRMSAARMKATSAAGTTTSTVHSATAGVRILRLQSKSAQHSQFQKHLSKTSMASFTTRYIMKMPRPVARGRSVIHWLSFAICAFSLGSSGRPRARASARSRPLRCITAVSSTNMMMPSAVSMRGSL